MYLNIFSETLYFQVIGENNVAVPTHLYKVVVASNDEKTVSGTFIVPNKPIDYSHTLLEYEVPIEQLEKNVGFKFFPSRRYA